MTHDWIMAEAERLQALGDTEPRLARDPVSQPIINAWLDAIEETDQRFTQGLAPPAMAQVWTMPGLRGTRGAGDPLSGAMEVLDTAGYTSVLGTNCDQTYERYLRVGERVSVTTRLESVVGPKQTGVGEGYFVTTRNVWRVGDEVVASMLFRVLKFKPRARSSEPVASSAVGEPGPEASSAPPPGAGVEAARSGDRNHPSARSSLRGASPIHAHPGGPGGAPGSGGAAADGASGVADRSKIIRPVRNRDTEYFWEGTRQGELRIQTCNVCGELRHPPGPVCPVCHAMDRGFVVASGRGTIFSFLVHHAPLMPGRELPVTIALVELEEGVRFVADVSGDPEDLAIGDAVVVGWDRVDDELTLPIWELLR